MRWSSTISPSWLSVAAVALWIGAPPSAAGEAAIDPAKLSNLVLQDCGSCHGMTLKGGLGTPLTAQHLRKWTRDQIVHIILDGVPGTPMPPWRPLLTETEAAWIANALKKGALK
jgi:cytochrome c55X